MSGLKRKTYPDKIIMIGRTSFANAVN